MKTNETNHSPSPWHCNLGNGSNLTNDCTVWDAAGNQVGTVGDNTLPHCLPQDVPNGKLIAAAPDLLAALKALTAQASIAGTHCLKERGFSDLHLAIANASDALKKTKVSP